MRLWSIHPRFLDRQGLIALWREGLLAQKVLAGKTKGYKFHPQLIRFRETKDPLGTIGLYLYYIAEEAKCRGYQFDTTKLLKVLVNRSPVPVSQGQVRYETEHLLRKLEKRDPALFARWADRKRLNPHPIFKVVPGEIHTWEKVL